MEKHSTSLGVFLFYQRAKQISYGRLRVVLILVRAKIHVYYILMSLTDNKSTITILN